MTTHRDDALLAEAQAHLLATARSTDRGAEPKWLADRRLQGERALEASGLPNRRSEDWKYTHVASALEPRFTAGDGEGALEATALPEALPEALRLVLVDGRFRADLSDEVSLDGLTAGPLSAHWGDAALESHLGAHAVAEGQGFVALNQAAFDDGIFIKVSPDTAASRPLHVVHVSTGDGVVSHPRHVIMVGYGAKATVVLQEIGLGSGPALTNTVVEVTLGDSARLDLYDVQEGNTDATRVSHTTATLGGHAHLHRRSLALGGRTSRSETTVRFAAQGSEAELDGLYLARGKSHQDHHLTLCHDQPRCFSRQLYKGILDEAGRGVFTGKVVVAEHAQQSKAEQGNHNLLLSRDARANTRPQLEIYADDVQCSHGATVGQLDDEALFYLRARGLDEAKARDLLTYAFASEALGDGPVGAWMERRLLGWLPGHTVSAADLHAGLEDLS